MLIQTKYSCLDTVYMRDNALEGQLSPARISAIDVTQNATLPVILYRLDSSSDMWREEQLLTLEEAELLIGKFNTGFNNMIDDNIDKNFL